MKSMVSIICILLILVGCAPLNDGTSDPRANSYEAFTVEMEAEDGKIVILSKAQGSDNNNKQKGWVGFAKGTHGIITFNLIDANNKTSCDSDPANSAEWVITQVALSKKGDPATEKGERFDSRQNGWIQNAFPGIDKNGILFDESIETARTSAVLVNANNNSGYQAAYYRIQAERCDGTGSPIETDPSIGNRGRK